MSSDVGGPEALRPVPSRDVVHQALATLDGGPASVGPLGFAVCAVMGLDTSGCSGSYELRQRLSWPGYLSCLRRMTEDGELVARSRQDWHNLTRGAVFPEVGHGSVQAYATPTAYDLWMERGAAPKPGPAEAGWEMAVVAARERVLREHAADVERYAREWMEARADGGGAGGVHGA